MHVFKNLLLSVIYFTYVFSSQNEPPPPYYSVAVHTLPPLKSYEEVVYGVGPGLTPPTQPHYIPQYPPPVAVPQVPRSIREYSCYTIQYFPETTMDRRCTGKTNGVTSRIFNMFVCCVS